MTSTPDGSIDQAELKRLAKDASEKEAYMRLLAAMNTPLDYAARIESEARYRMACDDFREADARYRAARSGIAPISGIYLDDLEGLVKAATALPWRGDTFGRGILGDFDADGWCEIARCSPHSLSSDARFKQWIKDRAYIVAACNALPKLIASHRAAQAAAEARIEKLRSACAPLLKALEADFTNELTECSITGCDDDLSVGTDEAADIALTFGHIRALRRALEETGNA